MICPNKNLQAWKDLVSEHGEEKALLLFLSSAPILDDVPSDIRQKIEHDIENSPEFFVKAYSKYTGAVLNAPSPSLVQIKETLIARAESLGGVVTGNLLQRGNETSLLYPESELQYNDSPPNVQLEKTLNKLFKKFKIGARMVHEPAAAWKGKYVNDGGNKFVVINTANYGPTTLLHEYYHPAVAILEKRNFTLFAALEQEARSSGLAGASEEVVTEYLALQAKENKITILVKSFFAFITRVLGIGQRLTIESSTSLYDLLQVLNDGVDLSGESTVMVAYQKAESLGNSIVGSITDAPIKDRPDYLEVLKAEKSLSTSDTSNYYQNEEGKDSAIRLTSFIGDEDLGEFSSTSKNVRYNKAEWIVRREFNDAGISVSDKLAGEIEGEIVYQGASRPFEEVLNIVEKDLSKQRIWGKLVHSFLQFKIETDPLKKKLAQQQALEHAKDYGDPFFSLEQHPRLKPIAENFNSILKQSGITTQSSENEGLPKKFFDKISAELVISSDLITDASGMPIATTADGLIQHYNGDFTLIDWKTGSITSDMNTAYLMKYGEDYGITDSKLSRAYLELAFRALILKSKFPEATFRDIKIVQIDSKGDTVQMKVDLAPYLYTIGKYYRTTNPNVFKNLSEKGLFDVEKYKGVNSSVVKIYSQIQGLPYEDQLQYLNSKLSALHSRKTKEQISKDPLLKEESALLTEAILQLKNIGAVDLDEKVPDLPYMGKIKNFSDIAHPKVQVLHTAILEAKQKVSEEFNDLQKHHDELFLKIVEKDSSTKVKGRLELLASASLGYSILSMSVPWFGMTLLGYAVLKRFLLKSTKSQFNFMWRESLDPFRRGYYMNLENTYLDETGIEVPMTKAQIEYRNFVQEAMAQKYKEFAFEVVDYQFGDVSKPIYKYQQLGLPEVLPNDFLPRIPKPIEEVRQEESFAAGGFGLRTGVQARAKHFLTSFIEDNFESSTGDGIPLKYFLHSSSPIVQSQSHSFDAEASFKLFLGQLLYKKEMDPVYDLSVGVSNALEEELDEKGKRRYPGLVEWLNDAIYPQILQNYKEVNVTSKKRHIKVTPLVSKITGLKEGRPIIISQDRVLRLLKSSVTFTTMAFKVWGPVRNALLVSLATLSKTTQTPINRILGVKDDTMDELSVDGARTVLQEFISKKILGKESESKLWNIAAKINWLPDDQVYKVNNDKLLSRPIQISTMSHAYMFYQLGEHFGALWHLAAIMKATKVTTADGKVTTLWDAHDDSGKWTAGKRGEIEISPGVTKNLEDLDVLEIKTLKRAYEKLQGSYRQDEKTALEATVIGDFLFQFKKYFYQYLKVLFASPYKDVSVGKYVMTGERPDGMPVYQWHSEVMEGQFRVLAGAILSLMSKKKSLREYLKAPGEYLNASPLQSSTTLKSGRRRAFASIVNTGLWIALLYTVFSQYFDDEDEKSYIAKEFERTIWDNSRGVYPKDLFETIQSPVVAAERVSQIGSSFWTFMTEGILGERSADGWLKGSKTLLKANPITGPEMQLQQLLGTQDLENQEAFFDFFPER